MMFQFGTYVSIRCPCGCKSTTSQYVLWTEGWLRIFAKLSVQWTNLWKVQRLRGEVSWELEFWWTCPYLCAVVISSHWSKGGGWDLGIFQIRKNTKHLLLVWMSKSLQQGLWSLDWKWGLPNCGRSRIRSMDSSLSNVYVQEFSGEGVGFYEATLERSSPSQENKNSVILGALFSSRISKIDRKLMWFDNAEGKNHGEKFSSEEEHNSETFLDDLPEDPLFPFPHSVGGDPVRSPFSVHATPPILTNVSNLARKEGTHKKYAGQKWKKSTRLPTKGGVPLMLLSIKGREDEWRFIGFHGEPDMNNHQGNFKMSESNILTPIMFCWGL